MNTKLYLASMLVTMALIAAACSPENNSLPNLDPAQPEEASYEIAHLVPVTGVNAAENAYSFEQEALAYPSQQSHSNCISQDSHRQALCEEKGPINVIRHSNNSYADTQDYPSQKLHSHCVSEDVNRQNNCIP